MTAEIINLQEYRDGLEQFGWHNNGTLFMSQAAFNRLQNTEGAREAMLTHDALTSVFMREARDIMDRRDDD